MNASSARILSHWNEFWERPTKPEALESLWVLTRISRQRDEGLKPPIDPQHLCFLNDEPPKGFEMTWDTAVRVHHELVGRSKCVKKPLGPAVGIPTSCSLLSCRIYND